MAGLVPIYNQPPHTSALLTSSEISHITHSQLNSLREITTVWQQSGPMRAGAEWLL